MSVPIVTTISGLREIVAAWRREGARIGVVPTMGALHEGHLSLVRAALEKADRLIVTLFVNPKQFNSQADLAAYARIEYLELRAEEDLAPMPTYDRPGRLIVAAWLGETRLIDNAEVPSRLASIAHKERAA